MKIQSPVTAPAAPQIKVRTDLAAGQNTCRQDTAYWKDEYNRLVRELKQRGCQ